MDESDKFGISKVNKEITTIFSTYSEIKEVILFGSRAIGNFKPTSDIDFAIKGNNISSILGKLKSDFEESNIIYAVDIVPFETISSQPLLNHIEKYGKVVYSIF